MSDQPLVPEFVYPWDIDVKSPRWQWATSFVSTRPYYDRRVWTAPRHGALSDQVRKFLPCLFGSRNFVLCFSKSPVYMRDFYNYLSATWALTTGDRFEIADIQSLIDAIFDRDNAAREMLETIDLLLLPYGDKDHVGLHKARGTLSNILMRRKAAGLATITDLYVTQQPSGKRWYLEEAQKVRDVFGRMAFELFYGDNAKYVYVTAPKRVQKGVNDERAGNPARSDGRGRGDHQVLHRSSSRHQGARDRTVHPEKSS